MTAHRMRKIKGYTWQSKIPCQEIEVGPAIDDFMSELCPTVTVRMIPSGEYLFRKNDRRSSKFKGKITFCVEGLPWEKTGDTLWPDESCGVPVTLKDAVMEAIKFQVDVYGDADPKTGKAKPDSELDEILKSMATELEGIAKGVRSLTSDGGK